MSDRSAELAKLIVEEGRGISFEQGCQLIKNRFSSLTVEELRRGVFIAHELLRAEAAEINREV